MRMKNPPHPGRIVRRECIEPLGLTVTETAKRLGVTRQALNNLVNGKGGIAAEMAVRLSKAFGSSPEVWLGMQMEYDLAQVEKEAHNIKVKRIAKSAEALRVAVRYKIRWYMKMNLREALHMVELRTMLARPSGLSLHLSGDVAHDSGSSSDAGRSGKIHRLAEVPVGSIAVRDADGI